MKKKFLITLTLYMIVFVFTIGLVACKDNNVKNGNTYSFDFGIKSDTLSNAEKTQYTKYFDDYAKILKSSYKNLWHESNTWDPFLFLDEIFVYDFKNVNSSTLNEDELRIYNEIANCLGEKPLLYIFCSGTTKYISNDMIWPISSIAMQTGIFIGENGKYICLDYRNICNKHYVYTVPSGVKIINFGNEFSFTYKPTVAELMAYNPTLTLLHSD